MVAQRGAPVGPTIDRDQVHAYGQIRQPAPVGQDAAHGQLARRAAERVPLPVVDGLLGQPEVASVPPPDLHEHERRRLRGVDGEDVHLVRGRPAGCVRRSASRSPRAGWRPGAHRRRRSAVRGLIERAPPPETAPGRSSAAYAGGHETGDAGVCPMGQRRLRDGPPVAVAPQGCAGLTIDSMRHRRRQHRHG